MPIATSPFAAAPFSAQDIVIISLSGQQLTIQEGFTQENTGATGNVQVGGQAMTLTLGQETGRIAPGNLDQQLNLSVNWNPTDFLVCKSGQITLWPNHTTFRPPKISYRPTKLYSV